MHGWFNRMACELVFGLWAWIAWWTQSHGALILTEKNRWFLVSLLSRSQKLESQQNSQQICWVGRAHSDRKKPMLFVLTLKRIEKNRYFLNLTGRVAFWECRDKNRMPKVSEILGRNSLSRIPSKFLSWKEIGYTCCLLTEITLIYSKVKEIYVNLPEQLRKFTLIHLKAQKFT